MNYGINRSLKSRDLQVTLNQIQAARLPQAKTILVERQVERSAGFEYRDGEEVAFISQDMHTMKSWDIQMEQLLGHARAQYVMKQAGTFDKARHTEAQYAKKMKWLNLRIREYEKLARSNPDCQQTEAQLQNLYMLKSSLKSVRDIIIP